MWCHPCALSRSGPQKLAIFDLCRHGIALVVYLIWQWLILGSLPQSAIKETLAAGQPVNVSAPGPHGQEFPVCHWAGVWVLCSGHFILGGCLFRRRFFSDGLKLKREKRPLLVLLTFVPPGICAALDPTLFETALSIAGGFGEAFLNGLLPVVLAWKYRSLRKGDLRTDGLLARNGTLAALFGVALFVMGLEVIILLK